METLEMGVLQLTQDQIKTADYKEVGRIAVRLERIDNASRTIGVSIGEWVHATADTIQTKYGGAVDGDRVAMERDFLGQMSMIESFLLSAEAGDYQVEKLPRSLDQAQRKLLYALQNGCDLKIQTSTNKVQTWNKKHRDAAEKEAKKKAADDYMRSLGVDPSKIGPQGVPSDAAEGMGQEVSKLQVQMAKIAAKLEEVAEAKPDQAEDMIAGFEQRVDKVLSEIKAGIGSKLVVNG